VQTLESAKDFLGQLSPLHIGAVALALAFLLVGLRLIFKKQPAHLTAFSGDAGNVLVSRKALQELAKQACLLDDWVEAARPTIRVRDNKVTALVELRLSSADNLKSACERIQGHITTLLQKSLSFEQIGDIQIVVKSFGKDADDATPAPAPSPSQTPAAESVLGETRENTGNPAASRHKAPPRPENE